MAARPARTAPNTLAPSDRLLDVAGLAELLAMSKSKVYRMAELGEGPPPIRIGARLRWRPAAVEQWLVEQEGRPG